MKLINKHTKIFFACSISNFIITVVLGFTTRYNQLIFILRHSTLYLGIAFLVPMTLSVFYKPYKKYFLNKGVSLIYLNFITLAVLAVSLVLIANSRLEYIAEYEVPNYMNEILYDDYNNEIYRSILIGVKPTVEVIEKIPNKLVLHIEEVCICQQTSSRIEEQYSLNNLDYFIDGTVDIFVDIEIIYDDNNSIISYTINETRNIMYEPEDLPKYYAYISRKLVIENQYKEDGITITKENYFYNVLYSEDEHLVIPLNEHYSFAEDQGIVSEMKLMSVYDENENELFIMQSQEQNKEIDEMVILYRLDDDLEYIQINFEESENRLVEDGIVLSLSFGPKLNRKGKITIRDNDIQYNQSYNFKTAGGITYVDTLRQYDLEFGKYVLKGNDNINGANSFVKTDYYYYSDLFTDKSYIEIVSRGGTPVQIISRGGNPLEVNNVKIFEIEEHKYGISVSYFFDVSPYSPYSYRENSHMYLFSERQKLDYFNYYHMLLRDTYEQSVIFDNNEMINFIAQK